MRISTGNHVYVYDSKRCSNLNVSSGKVRIVDKACGPSGPLGVLGYSGYSGMSGYTPPAKIENSSNSIFNNAKNVNWYTSSNKMRSNSYSM